jgi:hypothetical protein
MTTRKDLTLHLTTKDADNITYCIDEIGDYYEQKMKEKRKQVGDAAHTSASKSIGWK